jgi:short-subunit dehydrogenase
MRLNRDKRALVTGAASGIGRAISLELARRGVRLFLLDREPDALAEVVSAAKILGVDAIACQCDLTDPSQVSRAVRDVLARFGGLDLLINNAGIVYYGPTHEMSQAQWDAVTRVNLLAPIQLIHELLPTLREQPEAHILNVASITGLVPKRRIAAYQATKFALIGLSQSLRFEYSPYGLGVSAICPGFVETNLLKAAERTGMTTKRPKLKSWWVISPDRVAKVAVRAIENNRGLVVTPALAKLFWWMQRLAPWMLDVHVHLIHRRARRRKARKTQQRPPQVSFPSS